MGVVMGGGPAAVGGSPIARGGQEVSARLVAQDNSTRRGSRRWCSGGRWHAVADAMALVAKSQNCIHEASLAAVNVFFVFAQ